MAKEAGWKIQGDEETKFTVGPGNDHQAPKFRRVQKLACLALVMLILGPNIPLASGEKFGALHLCPPGGRSFMVAWNLACEMKRKKRSVDAVYLYSKRSPAPEGYTAATLSDIMNICCDVGCDIRDLLSYCDPFGPWNS